MPEERKSTPDEQKHRQGVVLFNQGSYEQAARLFAEALDIQETSDRWNDWATAQMLCEHGVSAERGFVYALELNPQNQQAAANLGTFLVRSERFVEALPLLERAMNGTGGQPDSVVATLLACCRAKVASGKAITGLKHPAKPVQKVLDSVFIHIPKTAGVSLRSRLERSLPLYSVSPHVHPSAMTEEEAGSLRAYAVVSGHISWIDAQRFFPDRKKFTFLRDPVDRCVSLVFLFPRYTPGTPHSPGANHLPCHSGRGTFTGKDIGYRGFLPVAAPYHQRTPLQLLCMAVGRSCAPQNEIDLRIGDSRPGTEKCGENRFHRLVRAAGRGFVSPLSLPGYSRKRIASA